MLSESRKLQAKYRVTSLVYDVLDYPWERHYRQWRPQIVGDVRGEVLEAGVGTGQNLRFYPRRTTVQAIDLSPGMLRRATRRAARARCHADLACGDATDLSRFEDGRFDWYISTFMYLLMPQSVQVKALAEMARVLKVGGRFRLVEIVYSRNPVTRLRQELFAPIVEQTYGARFDRHTLRNIGAIPSLQTQTRYLSGDTILLIEGHKIATGD